VVTDQENRLIVMLSVQIVAQSIAVLIALWELKHFKSFPYMPKLFSRALGRRLLSYGLAVIPGGIIYAIADTADRVMVGWFSGPEQVAIVALSYSVRGMVLAVSKWFGIVWEPVVVEWLATKNPNFYLPRLQNSLNILSVAFFVLACLTTIWIEWLIRLVFPTGYLPAAKLIPFLAIAAACATLSRVAVTTITLAGKPGLYLRCNTIALVIEILIGALTIPVLGAIGAALCTMAQEVTLLLGWWFIGRIALRNLPLDWRFPLCVMLVAIVFVAVYSSFGTKQVNLWVPLILSMALIASCLIYINWVRVSFGWTLRLRRSQ
jgi:O-antigen/teichoic acid export membrane protein